MRYCEIAKFESYPAAKKGDHHKGTKAPRHQGTKAPRHQDYRKGWVPCLLYKHFLRVFVTLWLVMSFFRSLLGFAFSQFLWQQFLLPFQRLFVSTTTHFSNLYCLIKFFRGFRVVVQKRIDASHRLVSAR
jgi:hypothetical protein